MPTTFDKPAGLPVMAPHADPSGDCVLKRLLGAEPWRAEVAWPEGFDGGIVHRLDTSTSGALLIADSIDDLATVRDWFASGRLRKTYRMVAARDVPWHANTCDFPIAHDRSHKGRMIVKRGESTPHRGRWYDAHTEFQRIAGRLWEVVITTGVTHQIRVHAAFVGIPLRGDRRYGGGERLPDMPAGVEFWLHCARMDGPGGFRSTPVALPPWAA